MSYETLCFVVNRPVCKVAAAAAATSSAVDDDERESCESGDRLLPTTMNYSNCWIAPEQSDAVA